jgi:DNA-binding transcriptional MerR regulator
MLLKIGDLAKRTGLTVRALHHYDSIKLLTPSARSDAGYRLYNHADIARLHQIVALRQFGLSLADIGTTLTSDAIKLPGPPPCASGCSIWKDNWSVGRNRTWPIG